MASSIKPRLLGGTEIYPIAYGCMGLSAFYGKTLPDEERFKVGALLQLSLVALTNTLAAGA